jgi:hypothetical protein
VRDRQIIPKEEEVDTTDQRGSEKRLLRLAQRLRDDEVSDYVEGREGVLKSLYAEATKLEAGEPWYITICVECGWTSHSPRPDITCPNDGSTVIRFPGSTWAWPLTEVCRAIYQANAATKSSAEASEHVEDALAAALVETGNA